MKTYSVLCVCVFVCVFRGMLSCITTDSLTDVKLLLPYNNSSCVCVCVCEGLCNEVMMKQTAVFTSESLLISILHQKNSR